MCKMSSETGNVEVQLREESIEICVAVTMEGSFRCEVGCAIIPVNSISKMYLPWKSNFHHQFEKTLQSLVFCLLPINCGLHVRTFDLDVVGHLLCASLLLNVFLEHFELIRGV